MRLQVAAPRQDVVDRMIVRSCRFSLMSERISTIWLGSSRWSVVEDQDVRS